MRRREAPVDASFREWATAEAGPEFAAIAASAAGVFSFDHDPGRLSAAFVWERLLRVTTLPPAARYVTGGWTPLVQSLERRARDLGVSIATGTRVEELPPAPVVVATELEDAGQLLGDDDLHWESGHCVCLDFAVRERRGDPFVISDLDEAGWAERFSAADPTLAPAGESLVQAQIGVRPGESIDEATARVEALVDCGFAHRAERQTWHRRVVIERRTGALDLPGTTWRDRPAVDRGEGRFLAGDKVAAPGLLSEVAWASAIEAARGAIAWRTGRREPSAVV
jgi:phytoene dehydrogenase-like protein